MTVVLRYAGLALVLLFVIAFALVCGESMCESGTHACCGRTGRIERLRRLVARLIASMSGRCRALVATLVGVRDVPSVLTPPSLMVEAAHVLRI